MKKIKQIKVSIYIVLIIVLNLFLNIFSIQNTYAVSTVTDSGAVPYALGVEPVPDGEKFGQTLGLWDGCQFWHYSEGYWKYTDNQTKRTTTITDDEMENIINGSTPQEPLTVSKVITDTGIINYLDGNGAKSVKPYITTPKIDTINNPDTDFSYRIQKLDGEWVISYTFTPKYNVEPNKNFWDGRPFVDTIPKLPVPKSGYGTEIFAVWTYSNPSNETAVEVDYTPEGHPYSGTDHYGVKSSEDIYLSGKDGRFYPNHDYYDTADRKLDINDRRIGAGTFNTGGAVGIAFYFSFYVDFHKLLEKGGDFQILDGSGKNVTDSNQNMNIGTGTYGNSYPITLKYTGDMTTVDHLEWINDEGLSTIAPKGSPTATLNVKGGLSPGVNHRYWLRIYYKDGSVYPNLSKTPPDPDNIEHYVNFTEVPGSGTGGGGDIQFNPKQSSDISGNREAWVKQDIPVTVTVTGAKIQTVQGSQSRSYRYWDSCLYVSCGEYSCWCVGGYVDSSSYCTTTDYYKINSLTVKGTGQTASGQTVNLPTQVIPDGGTYTITQELKNIKLHTEVTKWDFDHAVWNGMSPPRGSWTQNSPPSKTTVNPTFTYASDSGQYFLDKTAPTHTPLNPANSNNLNPQGNGTGWTNQTITVPVNIKDNLSGFWSDTTYFEIVDKSYIQQPTIKQNYIKASLDETKNAVTNKDGIYKINVHAEDVAQNQMTTATYEEYKYDSTNPYAAQYTRDYRTYIDADLTVTVTVGDNLSGVYITKWVLNNSPTDTSGMIQNSVQTRDRQIDYNTFNVAITQPGSWWIHVFQQDRAGNVTWTTSPEYKIIRLGNANNRSGQSFLGLSNQTWVEPRQTNDRIPRATRFDTLMEVYGETSSEATQSTVAMTLPAWVDDSITKKVDGAYTVTSGTVQHTMNYYTGHDTGPQGIATPSTVVQWWRAFIPPYGTPLTMDRNGNRLAPQTSISLQLTFPQYTPSKTHKSTVYFDIVPETKIKTEIIKNQY